MGLKDIIDYVKINMFVFEHKRTFNWIWYLFNEKERTTEIVLEMLTAYQLFQKSYHRILQNLI